MPEASDNGDDNDSDEENQYGDTNGLENGAHYKNTFLIMLKINHVPTTGLM